MTKFYGSVVNRIMECGRYPEITVGMGVTFTYWSDRSPGTVVAIRERNGELYEIDTVGDLHGPNLAVWPAQRYEITPTDPANLPEGTRVQTWRMDRRGYLRKTMINDNGRRVLTSPGCSPGIVIGSRDYYQDPSF